MGKLVGPICTLAFACAACGYPPLPAVTGAIAGDGGEGGDSGSGIPLDAAIDTPPGAVACFGTGIVKICLGSALTQPLGISSATTIDTAGSPLCVPVLSGGANYCVIAATTISIDAALRATGTKPLVLLASESITVMASGAIDVGSRHGAAPEVGAGADPATCDAGTVPSTAAGTSGGGAGGSFAGAGGAGGAGAAGGAGGRPGAAVASVTELRGGCPGQDGSSSGAARAAKGHGGGAVYLIAGSRINVQGGVNAAGEGAGGASNASSGGGGAGAGGMIGFDAPMITATSLILASGGGGGEGSGSALGVSGAEPNTIGAAPGGRGGSASGGDGGDGSAGAAGAAGAGGANGVLSGVSGGGGGGGGGAGLIKAPPAASLGTNVSPAPIP